MNLTDIEWCDYTWNPLVGCKRLCKDPSGKIFCYAYYQAKRNRKNCTHCYTFEPHLHPERLQDPMLKRTRPTKIFTISMGDLFGPWVTSEWFEKIVYCIQDNPQHTFILLTKYPQNIIPYFELSDEGDRVPDNIWIGTSVSSQKDDQRLEVISDVPARVKFASLEPLHSYIHFPWELLDWVIIGLQTGRKPIHPDKSTVIKVIDDILDTNTKLFIKNNARLTKGFPFHYVEFPDGTIPNPTKIKYLTKKTSLDQWIQV